MSKVLFQEIRLIREGEIYTDGLMACLGILKCFEKDGGRILAMGHHSSLRFANILKKWCDFIEEHSELKAYDVRRIIVAKMNPEPEMPNQIMQEDGRILTYFQRIDELISGLKIQHPKSKIEKINYFPNGYFKANLDNLTWETNSFKGFCI